EAIHAFVHKMLHNSAAAQQIEALWKEYEDRGTPEARFVKGASGISCITLEYERALNASALQPFYNTSIPYIEHEWGKDLLEERQRL
ncbi:hypothetical protein F5890DRAFT_1383483, partial [Lentinula detonsa]